MTKIKKCSCVNEFQDKRYGKGKRVFNSIGKAGRSAEGYRCTVCLKEKQEGEV